MKLLMINFIKYVFGVKKKLAIVPRSKKVPGGINKHEVEDFLKLLDNNQKFRVKKVLKDCIEID